MIHAALNEWLDFASDDVKKSGVIQIGESLDEISQAYNECVNGKLPKRPFMTINNTSCYDPSRAPPGKHTLWNFVRAPVFLDGRIWTVEEKERFAGSCIDRLCEYSPKAKQIILKEVILSPQDIESLNPNLVNGDPGWKCFTRSIPCFTSVPGVVSVQDSN